MWERDALEDASTYISRGISPKYTEKGGVLVINQKCVRNHSIDYSLARRHDIEKKNVKPERFIQKGDVLINSTGQGTLGRVAQVREEPPEPTTVDSHVTIVRPNLEKFYLDYFGYALIQIEDELKKSGQGTSGQTELAKTKVQKEFFASYPNDRKEQQRIVAKLDAAFAEIDRAIEGATSRESALGALKRAAIDSHFQSLNNEKRMGDVFEFVRGPFGGSLKKNMFVTEGFAVYEQQHAIRNQCNEFRYYVPQKKFDEMSRFRVSPNAILMSCSGTIGKTTIIPSNFIEGIINQALLMLKPNNEVVPKFATLYMNSKRFSQQLMERVEGAAQKNVASVKVLKEILIPLPQIEEQQQLVSDIEKFFSEIGIAKIITESTIENYIQLKSAILAQELQPPQIQAA